MKDFKTFEVLNAALGKVTPEAFKVLYYICNNLKLKNAIKTDIDRIDIAIRIGLWYDGCGKRLDFQLKKITKWTDELNDKGFIEKTVSYDTATNKRTVYYAIPETFIREQVSKNEQKQSDKCSKTYPTNKRTKVFKKLNDESTESKNLESQCEEAVPALGTPFEDGLPF